MAVVALMTLPQQMIAVPIYRIRGLGAMDSTLGYTACGLGLPIMYFMRNYFTTVPIEVEEAARWMAPDWVFCRLSCPCRCPWLSSCSAVHVGLERFLPGSDIAVLT